ncbi:MAG: S41 family peptidase [Desulfohalobiaceae bacterium]|nr:S41 family peptidase [Desulfohalobiaceae bacterium]
MRWFHYLGIVLILCALAGTPGTTKADEQYEPLKQFSQVMDLIERTYVREVSREELVQGAIKGMLKNLDPHSAYLDRESFQDMQVETSGEFTGIGIEITLMNGKLTVVSPIEDTPAYRAGLQAGDVILEIDGESTQDISIMDAVHKIRGPKGEAVVLTVMHPDSNRPEKIEVVRDVIPLNSVKTEKLETGYHYLRITNFNENTTEELNTALKKIRKSAQGIVLDLRNNPGGLLNQAVSVSDAFLSKGQIVYTKGKVKQSRMSFSAEEDESDIGAPIVVLINSGTASASEIVAGALQDHKRALIIGERSFGKGSVQTIIPLADGAGIKLTTARYYTPNGRSIQAEGIVPDLKVPFVPVKPDEQRLPLPRLREKDLSRHLKKEQTEESEKELGKAEKVNRMLKQDNQLRLGLQILKGMPVIKELHS